MPAMSAGEVNNNKKMSLEEKNLKFIDQSDGEEVDVNRSDAKKPKPNLNVNVGGDYAAIPQELNGGPRGHHQDAISEDTACGFGVLSGPVLQKCVKIESCPSLSI